MTVHQQIQQTWRRVLRSIGFSTAPPYSRQRAQLIQTVRSLIWRNEEIMIIDAGANRGQSVKAYRAAFPRATIHAFEPSPRVFNDQLLPEYGHTANVRLWNIALGCQCGTQTLLENSSSVMTSFLTPGEACWGSIVQRTEVAMTTLDSFTSNNDIEFIHILKIDTQGFDLEVLKGATRLLNEARIGMIAIEINFASLYEGQPELDSIYRHLRDQDFALAGLYKIRFLNGLLGWMDALFINRAFHAQRYRGQPGTIERI